MAEDEYVEPLSGEEIIVDFCSQIAEYLRKDCNLRPSDAYQNGYRGIAKVRLELYGMDQAVVEAEIPISAGKVAAGAEKPEIVQEEIEVPQETALNTVRERSDQPVPSLTTEEGEPVVRQRRYTRKVPAGGATGESLS